MSAPQSTLRRIAIVAGEASGDQLGADLIEALRARHPDLEVIGMAGPRMLAAGCRALARVDELAVMGLVDQRTSYEVAVPLLPSSPGAVHATVMLVPARAVCRRSATVAGGTSRVRADATFDTAPTLPASSFARNAKNSASSSGSPVTVNVCLVPAVTGVGPTTSVPLPNEASSRVLRDQRIS